MMCQQIKSKTVTSRTMWQCFGCCRSLHKGSHCVVNTIRGDGRIYDIRLCDICDRVAKKVTNMVDPYYKGDIQKLFEDEWNKEAMDRV